MIEMRWIYNAVGDKILQYRYRYPKYTSDIREDPKTWTFSAWKNVKDVPKT
jgi:hypothetical protein